MAVKNKKTFEPLDEKLLSNIPEELKKLKQWVCWKIQVDEKEEQRKRPFSPELQGWCSTVEPEHWTTFPRAVEGMKRFSCLGIGFVFTKTDPYVGIDLDACRDKKIGEYAKWAKEVISRFDTYGEISPSGTGIKMIVRGKLPGKGNRRGAVEMYEAARFFTITGNVGEELRPIAERQEQIEWLYRTYIATAPAESFVPPPPEPDSKELETIRAIPDAQLLRIAANAANGKKFKDLWDGSSAAHGDDESAADLALCALLAFYTGRDATRIDKLFRQSGLMRKKWDERRGRETYGQNTIRKACSSTRVTYDPAARFEELNDETNAEMYIELNADQFVHCSVFGKRGSGWLAFKNTHWSHHEGIEQSQAYVATEKVTNHLIEIAILEPDHDKRKRLLKWAVTSGDKYKKDAMIHIAANRMDVPPSVFDCDPMLIACKNGVIDLRKSNADEKLRPARREDYITRCAGAKFDPSASCPVFDKFLDEVMEGDQEMIKYLWRVMGYALTGDVRERAFFILHGGGRNGKTTLLETLMALTGTYAQKARFSSFLKKNFDDRPSDDVAHMAGARIVVASETEENTTLNTALIKELTGGDKVRCRFLYGKEFEFNPVAKFFFATNAIPNIYETTEAIWDRVHFIPFNYRVPEEKVDKLLGLKLRDELDAIFSTAVQWCSIWQAMGNLLAPKKVVADRNIQREDMDVIGEWISERVDLSDLEAKTTVAEAYNDYRQWTEKTRGRRAKPLAKIAVVRYLAAREVHTKPGTNNVKSFKGLSLRSFLA